MIICILGIGYPIIQNYPSFNNYFGQRAIVIQNNKRQNGWNGYCESSYFRPLAICVTSELKQILHHKHFIDKCKPGFEPKPGHRFPFWPNSSQVSTFNF